MKIAQVVSTFPPYKGGIGNTAYYFAVNLLAQNQAVTTFFPLYNEQAEFTSQLELKPLKPWWSKGNAAFVPTLYKELAGFDLIYFHYPFFGAVEALILRKIFHPRQKLVLYYHQDSMPPKDFLRKIIFYFYNSCWLPLIIRLADKIIVSSIDYLQNSNLAAYYKKKPTKFFAIPFGVDHQLFYPLELADIQLQEMKKVLDYQPLDKIVTYVGNLSSTHYFKGVEYLLKAVALLIKKNYQLKLCLVGRGNLIEHFKQFAAVLGIGKQLIILDKIEDKDLNFIYNLSTVVVLPSINRAEAFGLVLTEAMAAGKPVIATNLPGVRSVFVDQQSGLVCEIADSADLASKIEMIINDDDLAQRLGQAALLHSQQYDWSAAAIQLIEIFKQIVK